MTTTLSRPKTHRPDTSRTPPALRRVLAAVLFVAVCWVALLATMPAPQGNPVLRSSSPGSGELVKSPNEVRLTFDRPVPAELATVRIISPPGDQIVFTRPYHPAGQADALAVAMPATRYGGTYTVAWALPSDRLEQISGAFAFSVGVESTPAGVAEIAAEHDPWVAGAHIGSRIAALAAMALLIGSAVFVAAIWPAGVRTKPVRRVLIWSWAAVVLATCGVLVTAGPYAAWVPIADAFDPALLLATAGWPLGGGLLARLALLVPIGAGLLWLLAADPAETRRGRLLRGTAVAGAAAALAASWPLGRIRPIGTPTAAELAVDTVVLTAAGAGIAGIGLLALLALGGRRREPEVVLRRVTPMLVACSVLLLVAAGYHAWRSAVSGLPHWTAAGLGGLALLLAATTAAIRAWLRRRGESASAGPDRTELRRLLATSLAGTGVAAVLVGAAGALVIATAPSAAHAQRADTTPASILQQSTPLRLDFDTEKPGGTGSVDLALVPSRDGDRIRLHTHVTVLDETGAPTGRVQVRALLARENTPPVPLELKPASGSGHTAGTAVLPGPGKWAVVLNVRTPDGGQQTLAQPLDVD